MSLRLADGMALAAAAALALLFVGLAVAGAVGHYSPVPFWDMWDGYVGFITRVLAGDASAWLQRHVDHIILLTNVVFWLNFKLTGGNVAVLIAVNYLVAAVIAMEVAYLVAKSVEDAIIRWLVSLTAVALLFSWVQSENFAWAFQIQMFLAVAVPIATFIALYNSAQNARRSSLLFAVGVLLGILSVFTMANGIFALPVGLIMMLYLRQGFVRCAVLAVTTAVCWVVFFDGYSPGSAQGGGLSAALADPVGALHYLMVYLGSPASFALGTTKTWPALLAGTIFAVAAILMIGTMLLSRRRGPEVALAAVLVFLALTAIATASGRLVHGIEQALTSRYTTLVLTGWAATLGLAVGALERSGRKWARMASMTALLLPIGLIPSQTKALEDYRWHTYGDLIAALAISLSVHDERQISYVFPWIDVLLPIAKPAIDQNILIFSDPRFRGAAAALGEVRDASMVPGCTAVASTLRSISGETRFVRIEGFARIDNGGGMPGYFEILDANNAVVGRVIIDETAVEQSVSNAVAYLTARYVGYLTADAATASLNLLGPGSTRCLMPPLPTLTT
jgi:hypothetical protein